MAKHEQLFANLVAALRGNKVDNPIPLGAPGGDTLNYVLMILSVQASLGDTTAITRLCAIFETFLSEGHLYMPGPKGARYECGANGQHWAFNIGGVLLALKVGTDQNRQVLADLALRVLAAEIAMDGDFCLNDVVSLPQPRLKDEKRQAPIDKNRDQFLRLAKGMRVVKPFRYWMEDQNIAVAAARELFDSKRPIRDSLQKITQSKKAYVLYVPIVKEALKGEDGYVAYVKRDAKSEQAFGNDCCHWVRASTTGGLKFGYDWEPYDGGPEDVKF